MALSDLTRQAVLAAIAEFDDLGRDEFLKRCGFGRARGYCLEHDGKTYDSKAISGAIYGHVGAESAPLVVKI